MNAQNRIAPGVEAGVTEGMIAVLVHAFYAKVRRDEVLGPIFEAAIGDDWDAHLTKLWDFWSSVILKSGRFQGQPMVVHSQLAGIGPEHFARWLQMFGETAQEVCPPEAARLFVTKAETIAQSLQLGIAAARDDGPARAESILRGDRADGAPEVILRRRTV